MTQQLFIEILAGPGVGERVEITAERTLVGRGSQCDLRLASPHVSRQQCELIRQEDHLILENLGSVNVTYLNDRPIDRVYVQDGDLITFCDIALRVSFGAAVAADDPDRTVAYQSDQLPPGAVTQPPGTPQPLGPQSTAAQPPAFSGPAPATQQFPSVPSYGAAVPGHAPHSVGIPTAPPSRAVTGPKPPGPPPGLGQGPGGPAGTLGGRPRRRVRQPGAPSGGSGAGVNLPLIRNVAVGLMFVALLITVLGKILGGGGSAAPPVAVAPQVEKEKCEGADRNGRTDQEIVQDAQRNFEKGEVYFRQWQISDDSLSVALEAFCVAKANLRLVDKSKWPAFSRELDPAMEAAEEKVQREYSRIRISYNHYQQMGDLQAALQEMERALVLIPDPSDEQHQFARRKIGAVKAKMSGQGEHHRWEDRK